ncbi:MAG: carboxypeptidase regulatory-like domain-containing protein [Chthonomonas sp.]|nr:carboxypeptidase regulatory-like domain-containing protein [Chthonomonas sp.]
MQWPRIFVVWALALALTVVGCGGGTPKTTTSIISGRVTFEDGLPARGAVVTGRDGSAITTTNGSFVLTGQRAADLVIKAEITDNGTKYIGQNLARTYEGEQYPNVNIMVVPQNQTATVEGVVEDRNGNPLELARVFALGAGALSSTSVLTDKDGKFTLRYLLGNVNYEVSAGGGDYRSDSESVTLNVGEKRFIRFVLGNPGSPVFGPPQNLSAIAWTSPVSRDESLSAAVENLKRLVDPKRPKTSGRLSSSGNPVEIELEWDSISNPDLYGWGIYRARSNGSFSGLDFFREPLGSVYLDSDVNLTPNSEYSYHVTACNTRYPYDNGSESDPSADVAVTPLDDMRLRSTTLAPLTFAWEPVLGADNYVVYLFDRYPGFGVDSIWNNASDRATGNSKRYNGSIRLVTGKQYYFMVLGLGDSDSSRTISEVGAFIYQE